MMICLNKFTLKIVISITLLMASVMCLTQPAFASDGQSKQIAMQIAEKQTKGKAVRAQYKEMADKSGFRVRLLKEGKVIHTFVSMQQINRK